MIYVAEYYFEVDINEASLMLDKAMKSCPENTLYKWGHLSITDNRVEVNTEMKHLLSKQILNDNSTLTYLKNKGLLGEYTIGRIEATL